MRSKLKRFPEVREDAIDLKQGKAFLRAKPSFDQYVALLHALEEAGGAIQMFHPKYLVPEAHYAIVGVRGRDAEKLEALQNRLAEVRGVRSAIVDPDRWFTNEKGIDVGGAVIYADPNPRLELELGQAARQAGFIWEMKHHQDPRAGETSEMNHAFAGLMLILLAVLGMLQVGLHEPPAFIRYGTVGLWVLLFTFLFIRADPDYWPLGKASWFDGFHNWETFQHRIGYSLLIPIAVGDYLRIRKGWKVNPSLGRWGVLLVGAVGSGILFTHLHDTLDPAHYADVWRMNAQHIAMAIFGLLFAISKFAWDTWRFPGTRWGKYLWLACLAGMGVVLNLYVE